MTLPITWRANARADLAEIVRFVAAENPTAARQLRKLLMESVLPVSDHPYLYRESERIPGLREIVAHPNYLVFYRVAATYIEVVSVVHARREFPDW